MDEKLKKRNDTITGIQLEIAELKMRLGSAEKAPVGRDNVRRKKAVTADSDDYEITYNSGVRVQSSRLPILFVIRIATEANDTNNLTNPKYASDANAT